MEKRISRGWRLSKATSRSSKGRLWWVVLIIKRSFEGSE